MPDGDFMKIVEDCIHDLLLWVGFGTLVGLAAKAIMPGRDPGGAVATVLMGIAGSVVGCGTLLFFTDIQEITPISTIGFFAATGGAFILLFFYRLLSGSLLAESEDGDRFLFRKHRYRRRRELLSDS